MCLSRALPAKLWATGKAWVARLTATLGPDRKSRVGGLLVVWAPTTQPKKTKMPAWKNLLARRHTTGSDCGPLFLSRSLHGKLRHAGIAWEAALTAILGGDRTSRLGGLLVVWAPTLQRKNKPMRARKNLLAQGHTAGLGVGPLCLSRALHDKLWAAGIAWAAALTAILDRNQTSRGSGLINMVVWAPHPTEKIKMLPGKNLLAPRHTTGLG